MGTAFSALPFKYCLLFFSKSLSKYFLEKLIKVISHRCYAAVTLHYVFKVAGVMTAVMQLLQTLKSF